MEEKLVFKSLKDVPILSMSLQSTLWNRTGTWRYMRPSYRSLIAPCSNACPLGQDISFYLTSLSDGKPEEAWAKMLEANPFPSVCGRVCHHPCETECNRKNYDEALAVNSLERFLGDWGMKKGVANLPQVERKQEKIAVIGSGPAGLSCSYFLALKGYPVTVYEAMSEPGGMLRYGIPAYRLPRRILNGEIERVLSLGVNIETGKRLGEAVGPEDLREYGAVFLATGNWAEGNAKISGDGLNGVRHGLTFLRDVNSGRKIALGRKVVVIGGGNTAIDSARSAWRLGSRVTVLYRRSRKDMPAIPGEVEEAEKEGVEFIYNAAPAEILGKKESVRGVAALKTRPGKRDASGRSAPVLVPGTKFMLEADSVILAVGERADLACLPDGVKKDKGLIAADPWCRTALPGFFTGGDAATGEGTVSGAIASGKKAAGSIDRYLRGEEGTPAEDSREKATFDRINLDYFSALDRTRNSSLEVKKRRKRFLEIQKGFSESQARKEAGRCFSCGNCIQCNVCLMVCPDVAISFKEPQKEYAVDYDHCKGCGICAVECPRSAMALEEEKWSE